MTDLATRLRTLSPARQNLFLQNLQQAPHAAEPIAIVGMSCRFPGARNLDDFWKLIRDGVDATGEIPPSRWDVDELYDPDGDTPGKMNVRWGGFVEDADQFDPAFFGITPREASRMDPQQRLLLEVAWESLEHAGWPADKMAGSRTGVFVGIGGTDFSKIPAHFEDYMERIDAHAGTGNALSIAANRLSYIFDFRGPSFAVDTACSSALVALHAAVQNLRNHECDAALAGGVNMILSPETTIAFSKARMLSADGQCRPFDANANGYVRGEGCALVVLKRLTDAVRDGDNLLAVVRGVAVNQDGRTSGITAPNSQAQQGVIRAALAQAGLTTEQISYVEAHGTGTPLGDPIEFQSLTQLFRQQHESDHPCYVSSVKANIGHTETVSGMAGLLKVVMMLQSGQIHPQLHFKELNPNIRLDGTRLKIPTESVEWTGEGQLRRAGVSSFGFGGTNTHIVIEEASSPTVSPVESDRPKHLLALSAKSEEALRDLAQQVAQHSEQDTTATAANICHSANTGRNHFHHRLVVNTVDKLDLAEKLRSFAAGEDVRGASKARVKLLQRPRIAMLFTGQGSQHAGMTQTLFETQPTFRDAIEECNDILRHYLEVPLRDLLYGDNSSHEGLLDETAYTQPALFAVEYAMARLWQSWGITPDIVLGHSVGEYAAACVAGAFSLEDGLRLIAVRGQLMQQLPRDGKMAAVFASRETLEEFIQPHAETVSIAAINGPENTVLSGKSEVVDQLLGELTARGIKSQPLTVSHAFHSPLMDPMLDEFEDLASGIEFLPPEIPLISNLTGTLRKEESLSSKYWRDHIRNAVEFSAGMQSLLETEPDIILEVGPQPHLIGMARRFAKSNAIWLPSLRKGQDDWQALFHALSEMYCLGAEIDWQGFDRHWPRSRMQLPTYPFQRTRQWIDLGIRRSASAVSGGPAVHPLLGSRVNSALSTKLFQSRISESSPGYLRDHQVQGSIVVPGAVYMEIALSAAEQEFGPGAHTIEDFSIQQPMFLAGAASRTVQTCVSAGSAGEATVEIYSCSVDADESEWTLHACGRVCHATDEAECPSVSVDEILEAATDTRTRDEMYQLIAERGLAYGPMFQVLGDSSRVNDRSVAAVELPNMLQKQLSDYHLHPALLDGMLQTMAMIVPFEKDGTYSRYTYMPTGVRHLKVLGDPQQGTQIVSQRTLPIEDTPSPDVVEGNLSLLDEKGNALVQLEGVRIQRVGKQGPGAKEDDFGQWVYDIQWQPEEIGAADSPRTDRSAAGKWLLLSERNEQSKQLAAQLANAGGEPIFVEAGDAFRKVDSTNFIIDPTNLDDYASLLATVTDNEQTSLCGVIHLWNQNAKPQAEVADTIDVSAAQSLLRTIQSLARYRSSKPPMLAIVTCAAQAVTDKDIVNPAQTALWGMGRVAGMEHPELQCKLIDLPAAEDATATAAALVAELLAESDENQIACRNGCRYLARLRHCPEVLSTGPQGTEDICIPKTGPSRLRLAAAGSFEGLIVEPCARKQPPPGHVELEVRATGLNFSDVLKALGLYPGIRDEIVPLGIECGGVVTRIGEGVERFQVGDEVMGVAPYSFASHAVTADYALVHKPSSLDFEEAATVPITFLTAYYGLIRLADIQPGERVLIHAAAGGVGLAAIQIAHHLGAEVYATAGSQQKRDYLRSLGVKHIFNSRTVDFADQILEITNREGVDVVLNSLPGEAIPKSLGILRAYGRFLEIGKTDIYSNRMIGLAPFQDNLSYFAIDLDRMLRQRPEYIRKMFAEMMVYFADNIYQPLPLIQFDYADVRESFRYMAQRKNVGKVVVSVSSPSDVANADNDDETPVVDEQADESTFHANATYLITGGLGALGLQVARWLASQGARHIALLSRSAPQEAAIAAIEKLTRDKIHVVAVQGDVTDYDSLTAAIGTIPPDYPPMKGVIHAAGVLDDGVLYDMDFERLDRALAPKVAGAWNLHRATLDAPLDLFVLFSSVAATLGSPGQGNYAAGNAFLDGLAVQRRAMGQPALSIAWGPWAESGMATDAGRDEGMAARGMDLLPPEPALELLGELCRRNATAQVSAMSVRWGEMLALYRNGPPPLLTDIAAEADASTSTVVDEVDHALRSQLLKADSETRTELLKSYFCEQLAKIMGLDPTQLEVDQPLNTLGLDSLMAIELKNTVEARLRVSVPMAQFMEGPSVSTLAQQVGELLVGDEEDLDAADEEQSDDATGADPTPS